MLEALFRAVANNYQYTGLWQRVKPAAQAGYGAMVRRIPHLVEGARSYLFQSYRHAEDANGWIERVITDDSDYQPEWLTDEGGVRQRAMVVLGEYLYFIGEQALEEGTEMSIGRVKLDGTGYEQNWRYAGGSLSTAPNAIATDGTYIYASVHGEEPGIYRWSVTGEAQTLVVAFPEGHAPESITIDRDEGALYWIDSDLFHVGTSTLTGGEPNFTWATLLEVAGEGGEGGLASVEETEELPNAEEVVLSPDGKHAYVREYVSGGEAMLWQFARNVTTGALTPLEPATIELPSSECERIVISPDGKFVYVALRTKAILILRRDAETGQLTFVESFATAYEPADLILSPDGKSAYIEGYKREPYAAVVAQYARDTETGKLTPLEPLYVLEGEEFYGLAITPDGKNVYLGLEAAPLETRWRIYQFSRDTETGVLTSLGYFNPPEVETLWTLGLSPDGRHVYITANDSGTKAGCILQYERTESGELTALTPERIIQTFVPSYTKPLVSADGRNVYLPGAVSPAHISQYRRNITTGQLTALEPPSIELPPGREESSQHLFAESPNGKFLYLVVNVIGGESPREHAFVEVLSRDASPGEEEAGQLKFLQEKPGEGEALCVSPDGKNLYAGTYQYARNPFTGGLTPLEPAKWREGEPFAAEDMWASADGKNVYLVDAPLRVLSRDPTTGLLTFMEEWLTGESEVGWGVVESPDGKNIYINGSASSAIMAQFSRNPETGALTPLEPALLVQPNPKLYYDSTVISPDGKSLYVAGSSEGFPGSRMVMEFDRDPETGLLSERGEFVFVEGESGTGSLAISPDGKNLYVTHNSGEAQLWQLSIDAEGKLHLLEPAALGEGTGSRWTVIVSPDGRNVYSSVEGGESTRIAEFSRNPATGLLAPLEPPDTAMPGTAAVSLMWHMAMSSDGRQLYLMAKTGPGNRIFVLTRIPFSELGATRQKGLVTAKAEGDATCLFITGVGETQNSLGKIVVAGLLELAELIEEWRPNASAIGPLAYDGTYLYYAHRGYIGRITPVGGLLGPTYINRPESELQSGGLALENIPQEEADWEVRLEKQLGGRSLLASTLVAALEVGWHELGFDIVGQKLLVYLDGVLILEAEDASFTGGYVGIESNAEDRFGLRQLKMDGKLIDDFERTEDPLGGGEGGGEGYRGVNSHAPYYWEVSEADVKREIEEAVALGVTHLRVPIEWSGIEGAEGVRGGPALERLDLIVSEAAANGIKINGTIATTPPWASPGGTWNDAPLEPEASLRGFTKWLIERYGGQFIAVGVWNEPTKAENLRSPTGEALNGETAEGRRRRAYYYVQMVKAVFNGAREGNPAVKVMEHEAGAEEAGGIKPLLFLKACLEGGLPHGAEPAQEGFAGFYDAVALHAYSEGAAPEAPYPETTKSKIERLHAYLVEVEGTPVPIWVNEWGYSIENSEETNATYIGKGVTLLNGIPYVEGWALYQLRDTVEGEGAEANFGLLKFDFTPRPSFAAFKGSGGLKSPWVVLPWTSDKGHCG